VRVRRYDGGEYVSEVRKLVIVRLGEIQLLFARTASGHVATSPIRLSNFKFPV
jgi:hypothetical protein